MITQQDILKLLACPRCGHELLLIKAYSDELGIKQGTLLCQGCKKRFTIKDRMFNLVSQEKLPCDGTWNLANFENFYAKVGYYKSSAEWRKKARVPEAITTYDYPRVKGRLLKWLRPDLNEKILDVGTGSGYFLFEVLKRYSNRVNSLIGLDISYHHLKWLVRRIEEERESRIIAVNSDACNMPFQNGVFDKIICTEVLEHVQDPWKAISEIARVLKTDGKLFISTVSRSAAKLWTFLNPPKLRVSQSSPYDNPLNPSLLKRALKDHKFTILKYETNVVIPPLGRRWNYLPSYALKLILRFAGFAEDRMKVGRWTGLHIMLEAIKR